MSAPRTRTPRRVYLLGQQFDVRAFERSSDITGTDAHGLLGQCDYESRVLKLARSHGGDVVGADGFTETFLHEVLHALTGMMGRDQFVEGEDEAFVDRFSPILLDFIRRNKGVVAWLQRRD